MEKVCDTFTEVGINEPNWLAVSNNLGLNLLGQVSAGELWQAWHNPSWETMSRALGQLRGYHKVAEVAKKNAGVCVVLVCVFNSTTFSHLLHN